MNQQFRHRDRPGATGEIARRWRWTLDQFERMIEFGIIDTDDKVELIDGEIVPMAAKETAHENMRGALLDWFMDNLPRHVRLREELGWRADAATYCEPDFLIFARGVRNVSRIPAADVLLAIEISDTTLRKDLKTKAALYSRLGVREYWVVNALTHETHVHRDPSPDGYLSRHKVAKTRRLTAMLVPEIALRLADLSGD